MAKRKKSSKRKSSRRRRMSGVGGDTVQNVLGVAGGAVASKLAGDQMAINMPDVKPNLVIGGKALIALLLIAKVKNPLLKAAGAGMLAEAAISAAQSFGFINGLGSTNLVTFRANPAVNGLDQSIAGLVDMNDEYGEMGNLSVIAGTSM